jgi:hypothetical protein
MEELQLVGSVTMHRSVDGRHLVGSVSVNSCTYTASYGILKDIRYSEHKLALRLLEQAALHHHCARESLLRLSKRPLFFKTFALATSESKSVEYKGGKQEMHSMDDKSAMNVTTGIGKAACGMANGQGGSIFVGIHASTLRVQGILTKSPDALHRRMMNSLRDRLKPTPDAYLSIVTHPVHSFSETFATVRPVRPPDVGEYTRSLEDTIFRWSQLVEELEELDKSRSDQNMKCILLEIQVLAASELIFFDGQAYVRHERETVAMTRDNLIQAILKQYGRADSAKCCCELS